MCALNCACKFMGFVFVLALTEGAEALPYHLAIRPGGREALLPTADHS